MAAHLLRFRPVRRVARALRYSAPVCFSTETDASKLPNQARVVVIGGGIIGNSVAYHLVRHQGFEDVVLLERDQLTSGTTWHAAGLMATFGSTSETSTELRKYTKAMYDGILEQETGMATGFKPVGFIEVAKGKDRLEEYRRVAAFNRLCGVDVHELSPREVKELFPLVDTKGLEAGFHVPTDGRVNPVDATMAFSRGATMKGAKVVTGCVAHGVTAEAGRVRGVDTSLGHIRAEYVVNCAGMWARQLGQQHGVSVPLQAAEHYYFITDALEGCVPELPVLEDPDSYAYYREEGGGLMIGLFEPRAAAWNVGAIPDAFSFGQITPDLDRVGPYLERAMARVPGTFRVGMRTMFCGPESFTPDLAPAVGEAPELRGYFVAAGLNSIGITTGGGLGRLLAQWIVEGSPDMDVTGMNVDRLRPNQTNPEFRKARVEEALGKVYKCHYPNTPTLSGRGVKRSPFHDRLAAQGAHFKDVSGWEGTDWFAPPGTTPEPGPLSWGREQWFPQWEAEHAACREGVAAFDMSFMSKFLVQGPDAGALLNWVSAGNVDGACDAITYTQWLNARGGLEADVTVMKRRSGDGVDHEFTVVATDTAHRHVETWLRRAARDRGFAACVSDVTSATGQLNLQGPRSRELLQSLTSVDLSNDAFPFRCVREIDIGLARALCVRITYVGELGYELYIPSEQAAYVFDKVMDAGQEFGLRCAGLKALGSLRMEKGYRDYGHDIDNTDSVLQAGLGFAVDLNKPDGFIGRDAVLAEKEAGPLARRMVSVLVTDPEPLMCHAEPLLRDGVPVGYIRAASYGHTLGGAVGLAMVEQQQEQPLNPSYLRNGQWEVDIAGTRYPAKVSLRPLYDPKMAKVKA